MPYEIGNFCCFLLLLTDRHHHHLGGHTIERISNKMPKFSLVKLICNLSCGRDKIYQLLMTDPQNAEQQCGQTESSRETSFIGGFAILLNGLHVAHSFYWWTVWQQHSSTSAQLQTGFYGLQLQYLCVHCKKCTWKLLKVKDFRLLLGKCLNINVFQWF